MIQEIEIGVGARLERILEPLLHVSLVRVRNVRRSPGMRVGVAADACIGSNKRKRLARG